MNAQPARILIVDDLPEKHLVLGSILEDLVDEVVSVRSGREALAQLLSHQFAVILLDVNMPDIDGLETAYLIRNHRRSARTPILFITAYVDDEQSRRGYALGAVDYISSPVVPQVLRSKVRVFVELFRMNLELQARAVEREALARAQAAQVVAEQASARADFLAEASQRLSRSLDIEQTRQALLALAVPRLAREAFLVDGNGQVLASAPADRGVQPMPVPLADAVARLLDEGQASQLQQDVSGPEGAVLALRPQSPQDGALVLSEPAGGLDDARLALARELASRAAIAIENARLYAAVREADRRKNEFLAMLAHELRNPLAPIRNAVHIMQGAPDSPATLRWAREVVRRQAEQMSRLIDDLLDVARIVQGKVAVKPEALWLDGVVERCVETMAPRLQARGQTLALCLPPEPVGLDGDAMRLAQVLSNLVHNASKFSPPGAVITLSARLELGELVLSVRDPGCGIVPELLPVIFDLFAQGEQPLDRSQGGLGIGLTLVRHLVELHGGRVEAYSAGPGRGTEVTVRLPVRTVPSRAAPDASATSDPGAVPCRRAVRVMVVDDQAASAETLMLLLEMEGFEVRVAGEGVEALRIASAFEPDAVLLDIGLPGMSGFEVASLLRQSPATRQALLVALTGYGETESRSRSAEAGFDIHMVKPADLEQLIRLLVDPTRARREAKCLEPAATIVVSGEVDERFKSHAWKACEG